VKLNEEGLGLPLVGFAIRLKKIMEENGINEDQIEPIIQDFAAYCLRHNVSYDTVIQSGREALYLEEKFGIPVEDTRTYYSRKGNNRQVGRAKTGDTKAKAAGTKRA
jgi:hypothetical protein